MRPRNLFTAFVLSLLLHALLAIVLWSVTPRLRPRIEPVDRRPLEVQIVHLPPETQRAPKSAPQSPSPYPRGERTPPPPPAERTQVPPQHPAEHAPREDAAIQTPDESATPPRLSLVPRAPAGGIEQPSGEAPRGRTIYPDDPSLSEAAKRAEEELRVKGRVDGSADDAAAEARAQRGLLHPYLTEVSDALRGGLNSAKGGAPVALGGPNTVEFLFNRDRSAAEQYAKTGDPGVVPPGQAPRQTEKQRDLFGNEGESTFMDREYGEAFLSYLQKIEALTQSADTLQNLVNGAPLLALTMELRQQPSGQILSEKVTERSSSAKFDAFVLRVAPEAIARLGPVPQEALRGRGELRSVWRIQGWARLPWNLDRAMTLLGAPALQGVPMDVVAKQLAAHEQFDFRVRLLRAY